MDTLNISVQVKNTGSVVGAEVVQLYVQNAIASVDRPIKELKGFSKVHLNAGESKTITMQFSKADFSFWDEKSKAWKAEQGKFTILIGNSSRNTPLKIKYFLKNEL